MVNKFLHPNGGSETYMFKLGEYLTSVGNEVEYFGMEHPQRCVSNSVGAYTANMDFHNSSPLQKILLSLKTIYSFEARKKIRRVLDSFKPEVVHLNNFNYQLTPSVIVEIRKWEKQTKNKVKLVYTAHDYQLICPNHMLYNNDEVCEKCLYGGYASCTKGKCVHNSLLKSAIGTLEAFYWNKRRIYEQLDCVICCSEFMKAKLDTNPIFKNKTVAMHNFVDRVTAPDVKKGDYVLYFGRLSREKGIYTMLDCDDTKFVVAGGGPLEECVKSSDNCEYVGFKSGDELASLIAGARLTVYPSIWYENCPFSVMESIMYGTPVVASSIGGIPELIENGKTGLLVNPNDSNALQAGIKKLAEDADTASSMSNACLEYKFDTVEDYCKKLMKIYSND